MRKFLLVLLGIFMILSCACSVAETPDDELTEDNGEVSDDITNEDPSGMPGDVDISDINNNENIESGMYVDTHAGILIDIDWVQGFYDGNLIYTKSSSDEFNSADGGSSLIDYCKYNISTGESEILGSTLASYASGDVAYINDKMYAYEGGSSEDETFLDWSSEVSLLEIGLNDGSFRVVKKENLYTSVVWLKSCGDYIISVKKAEDETMYLSKMDPQANNAEEDILINFDSDIDGYYKRFATDNEKIYVLYENISSDNTVSHYINIYDINGSLLEKKELSADISEFILDSSRVEISVFSHYLMISSHMDLGYILDLNSDNWDIVLTSYSPRVSDSAKTTDDVYIFSTSLGKVWKYDRGTDKIIELSGKFEGITCMRVCDDDIIVHANSEVYYFPNGSFIVEE